jgi:hypothetical protein
MIEQVKPRYVHAPVPRSPPFTNYLSPSRSGGVGELFGCVDNYLRDRSAGENHGIGGGKEEVEKTEGRPKRRRDELQVGRRWKGRGEEGGGRREGQKLAIQQASETGEVTGKQKVVRRADRASFERAAKTSLSHPPQSDDTGKEHMQMNEGNR